MSKTILKRQASQATSADDSIDDANATVMLTGEHACTAVCPENQQLTESCEEAIRTLAHHQWEAAGCPAGDGVNFWLEAERKVNAERSRSMPAQG